MALPYLAASWIPAVARLLPRPGAWMDTFRRLMAFPMFATVAWLVWVLGQQSGIDGAGALLALLVALSMVVWALHPARPRAHRARIAVGCRAGRAGLGHRPRPSPGSPEQQAARSRQRALADLGAGPGRPAARVRAAGVRRLHRRLVRDLPVQQDHAGPPRCAGRPEGQERRPAARRLDPARARPSRPPWPSWDATACRCTCSTSSGSAPVVLSEVLGVGEVRSAIAKL